MDSCRCVLVLIIRNAVVECGCTVVQLRMCAVCEVCVCARVRGGVYLWCGCMWVASITRLI